MEHRVTRPMLKAGGRVVEELGDKAEPSALAKQVYNAMSDVANEPDVEQVGPKMIWFMTESEAALGILLLFLVGMLLWLKLVG